jgi:hypothetical protein
MTSLRALQRWFAAVVVHPGTVEEAFADRAVQRLVLRRAPSALLVPPTNGDLATRCGVYNGGYLERLVEVMQGDFGGVQQVLGEASFRALAARYLQRHPSRHPNLNRLGRAFPAFVSKQRALPKRAFVAELAQLELALTIAFDAPEFTPLAAAAIAAVPADRLGAIRLRANPSLQLLTFRHPVDVWYQAWKDGKPTAAPRAQRSWLAVYRRDDRVWRQRLTRAEFLVLSALQAGQPLASALAKAPATAKVREWFAEWAQNGFFTALRRGPSTKARR